MGPLASVYLGGGDCLCTFVLLFLFPVLIKPLLALPIDPETGREVALRKTVPMPGGC